MFAFRDTHGRTSVAFTDRHGGASGGPFASLNLTDATGDDPSDVRTNLDRVAAALRAAPDTGAPRLRLALMHQVHGADVHVVDAHPSVGPGDQRQVPIADALVTTQPDVVLVVRVADCVPVLLADERAGVLGAAHAGRPGLVAGVVPATLAAMEALGARRIRAWVGPHVCGSCYEVPDEMRAAVSAVVPEADARTSWGTPALDIGAGVLAQLDAGGVEVVAGRGSGPAGARCTVEDNDLYSYRRQGRASGRMAGLVWRRG